MYPYGNRGDAQHIFFFQNPNPQFIPNQPYLIPNFAMQHQNPNFNVPIHHHNPTFPIQTPGFHVQNPNFHPTGNPNLNNMKRDEDVKYNIKEKPSECQNFPVENPSTSVKTKPKKVEKVEKAVVKARRDIAAKGEYVSAWKVSQSALLKVKAESWDSLGFKMQEVPSLYDLMLIEGKINSFIHCFVGVRRITTLFDLELAICESEGIKEFEELGLGPLVRHPLVIHYFCVSSDSTEVFRISTEEIISYLIELTGRRKKKEIKADDLLDYVAKKRLVEGKEKLNVRIQSLGMHITHIQKARQLEDTTMMKCLEGVGKKEKKKRPLFTSQKKQLDENFTAISQRVKSFSSAHGDSIGKHIRFNSSSSGDDEYDSMDSDDNEDEGCSGSHSGFSSKIMNSSDRVSSCPYPSAAEEMTRLGIVSEKNEIPSLARGSLNSNENVEPSSKKRKSYKISCPSPPRKLHKRDGVEHDNVNDTAEKGFSHQDEVDISLDDDSMRMFITTWKETCKGNSVAEILYRMLQFYKPKRRKKVISLFSEHPYLGLLNVALKSIKHGMWDSIYDTFQTFDQQALGTTTSDGYTDYVSIEVEPSEKHVKPVAKRHDVTVEGILKKISAFFEDYHEIPGDMSSPLGKTAVFFKKLYKCEMWLNEQLSVDNFESLGYGEFLAFLARNVSQLPPLFEKCLLSDHICENQSLDACLPKHILDALVAEVSTSLLESETLNTQKVSEFLARQFPLISFKLVGGGSVIDLHGMTKLHKSNDVSKHILFSASLTVPGNVKEFSETHVSTKDAVEVLLRAPMLADLNSWTHWDLLFAPSFGPLMEWLINEDNNYGILCLVTRSGKIIRIDNTSTVDKFLQAFLQGSAFQTAVELLSLFALYGGERNIPLSLLKLHAEKAFRVIIKNSMDNEVIDSKKSVVSELNKDRIEVNKTVAVASRFFLDCLAYLPVEFRRFTADLLLSGFQSIVKDSPSAILGQCTREEDHLMLHELGLSLGIVEWLNDYHTFSSLQTAKSSEVDRVKYTVDTFVSAEDEVLISVKDDQQIENRNEIVAMANRMEISSDTSGPSYIQHLTDSEKGAALLIESIRREEFGLDRNLSDKESNILKKQHARLGRALHCLSQELYSQDSHFLLELVQNADDNVYPGDVEPTLTFILQERGIIVLNNELGFSAENIRALCDVGNSTKKDQSAGYIGKKGIGFKSVFRVTDAPEIHSGGFHIKFDISKGQIGFVLPTVVPPCDTALYSKLVSMDSDSVVKNCWNTCIVLPFRSKLTEPFSTEAIISMFSDLHPSLLLFLHRLECIMFRNLLSNSLIVMRKKVMGGGIVNVSVGKEKMTWFIESHKLQANVIRHDVHTTEISLAFTLEETSEGNYIPKLEQQPVFAFLPLRVYGLKFILQADFFLTSSREEVDGDSPWNQWLLSEFPSLFVSAERSFCSLPCFRENPGKGVSAFMCFVPLVGEVHGFFSTLPRTIISKLRTSNCLILEGENNEWVPPCKVLRNWTEQARSLLPDKMIGQHLGLGFLNKDTVLTDSLARALGIEDYGPKILLQIMSSLCCSESSLQSMGQSWLCSWLDALYVMSFNSSGRSTLDFGTEPDVIKYLRKLHFIPLLSGRYGSVDEGTIWLHTDALSNECATRNELESFGKLYSKLRIVSPGLFNGAVVDNVIQMLYKVGVQQLSAHEVLKVHVLPAICDYKFTTENDDLMVEYLSFIMFHLHSACPNCSVDRENIISELQRKAFISTNHGYKRLVEVPIHFNKDFGNTIEINKLINGIDIRWYEVDNGYLKHPATNSLSGGTLKWRKFLQELGVTDFVQIVEVEKSLTEIYHAVLMDMISDLKVIPSGLTAKDWESQELAQLLSQLSSSSDREKCKYLLEVLDTLWDDYFSDKLTGCCDVNGELKSFKSSVISILCDIPWIPSSMDDELHYPKDLFHDCGAVHSILGNTAPYAVPQVQNLRLLSDIGLKATVTLDDTLSVLQVWRRSEAPFRASISQMSTFYHFLWSEMGSSKQKIVDNLCSGAFIFVPFSCGSMHEVVPGLFFSSHEVNWHDSTGSLEQMKLIRPQDGQHMTHLPFSKMLCDVYPGLYGFFVTECGVTENLPLRNYLQVLLQLSTGILPMQAGKTVFQVFLKWADGLNSGLLSCEDVEYLKNRLVEKEFTVLPTLLDKWVSLHPSFGLICWCDDKKLRKEFKKLNNVNFLYLGELNGQEKLMLQEKVSIIVRRLGIPVLSEVVTREAIYYGPADSSFKESFVNWTLPYAQRYIYNVHPNEYSQLKRSGFENINRLQVVVVEKLFYRNVIKKFDISSRKRFECSCLLQGNILYATRESDSHSIFMELSRFLIAGNPDLHLANFLHMITTMAESGSTEEQTEFFILNSQNIPKLPDGELPWLLESAPLLDENVMIPATVSNLTMMNEPNLSKSTRKSRSKSNWPPVNWKNAPGFDFASKTQAFTTQMKEIDADEEIASTQADIMALTESNADWSIEENPPSTLPRFVLQDSEALKDESEFGREISPSVVNSGSNSGNMMTTSGIEKPSSSNLTMRDQLHSGTFNQQQATLTGKLGELIAFKYFSTKVGEKHVKWVNEAKETGLPYDLVVKGKNKSKEYIEVKATKSATKDWFEITANEWQFAVEKGESFSIARVVLSRNQLAQVTVYQNPVKLCKFGHLQLAVIAPKQQNDVSIL